MMKTHLLFIFALWAGYLTEIHAQKATETLTVEVSNEWTKSKTDEPVVIDLNSLNTGFTVLSATVWEGEKEIPSQLDDLDGDARADELAFLTDLPAQSSKQFRIVLSAEKSDKTYPARTYAQMMAYGSGKKYAHITGFSAAGSENVYSFVYHHGPGFESELVGYRVYFDDKQTVDPYSKVSKKLELKETCFYPTPEQRANGYGDDALRVYNSGGVGALKGWNGKEATHIKPVVNRIERVLASGPVRAIVEAQVTGWEYQGSRLNMINRYTIYGGHRDIRIDVIFDRPLGNETFAAGVQILKQGDHMTDHEGLLGSWGTDWPVSDTIGYVKETTGMGTFIPAYRVQETEDASNYLYTLQAPGKERFHYYATFTSQKETFGFKGMKDWFDYLPEWKETLKHPCKVTLQPSGSASNYVSQVWVADQGDDTYRNPVLYADYSDPDVCRVGNDYYLTSSSFNSLPGLQILHSKDLVNWTILGAAIPYAIPPVNDVRPEHGNRIWAPSIRHHDGWFYIFWGDPDQGAFMTKAQKPEGPWSEPVLVKAGKGIIDTTPLWDEDGRVYMVHAYAGSRAGLKSVIAVCELNTAADKAITPSRIVFDGHEAHETCEGPKFYKRNGYYYIFHPAGGVPTGWQVVLRSRNVYGPYEWKTVMAQGKSSINGPHQGGWVDTPTGEDWFMHFQDVGAYGRLVHLQPMKWVNDWPVIGVDKDGDGCGDPVLTYKKPHVGGNYPICTPQESDEFDGYTLSPQWQWQANINEKWAFCKGSEGYIRLYSYPVPDDYKSLWDVSNLMLQKTPAPQFTATTKLTFCPTQKYTGERTGLVVMGMDYAALVVENTPQGLVLSQVECKKADRGGTEQAHASVPLKKGTVYLRAKFSANGEKIKASEGGHDLMVKCEMSYSTDGKKFQPLGEPFQVKEGKWVGAKVGIFCTRPAITTNDGGWTDADWFRIEK